MDWHTRTQRQVGADGVEALRHWLYGVGSSPRTRQQPPVNAISIAVLLVTLVAALLVITGVHPAAAAPLPPGDYRVTLEGGDVWITVGPDGSATVAADDGLVAVLSFDGDGRALDEFSVASSAGLHRVEIDVQRDGDHRVQASLVDPSGPEEAVAPTGDLTNTPSQQAAAASSHGEAVLVVANCAPQGAQARASGWPTHGTVVSRVASGLPLSAAVTDPATGATTQVETRVTTVEDAVAFCSLVADLTTAFPPAAGSDAPQLGRDVPAADDGPSRGQGRPAAPGGHDPPSSDPGPPSEAGQGGAAERPGPGPPERTTGRAANDGGSTPGGSAGTGATPSTPDQGSSATPASSADQSDASDTGRSDAPSAQPQLDAPQEHPSLSGATASANARSSHAQR